MQTSRHRIKRYTVLYIQNRGTNRTIILKYYYVQRELASNHSHYRKRKVCGFFKDTVGTNETHFLCALFGAIKTGGTLNDPKSDLHLHFREKADILR